MEKHMDFPGQTRSQSSKMPNTIHPLSKFILAVIELLFIGRIIIKAFAVSSEVIVIDLTVKITEFLLVPFEFIENTLDYGRRTFEFKVIPAMIIYLIAGYVLTEFIRVVLPKSHTVIDHRIPDGDVEEDEEEIPR